MLLHLPHLSSPLPRPRNPILILRLEIRQIRIRRLGLQGRVRLRGGLTRSNRIIRRIADTEAALVRGRLVADGEPWVPTPDVGRVVAFRRAGGLQRDFAPEPARGRLETYVCSRAFVARGKVEGGVELVGGGDERGGGEGAGAVVGGAFGVVEAAEGEGAHGGGGGGGEGCGCWKVVGWGGAADAEGGVAVESVDDVVPEVDVVVDGLVGVEDAAVGGFVGELQRWAGGVFFPDGVFQVEAGVSVDEIDVVAAGGERGGDAGGEIDGLVDVGVKAGGVVLFGSTGTTHRLHGPKHRLASCDDGSSASFVVHLFNKPCTSGRAECIGQDDDILCCEWRGCCCCPIAESKNDNVSCPLVIDDTGEILALDGGEKVAMIRVRPKELAERSEVLPRRCVEIVCCSPI